MKKYIFVLFAFFAIFSFSQSESLVFDYKIDLAISPEKQSISSNVKMESKTSVFAPVQFRLLKNLEVNVSKNANWNVSFDKSEENYQIITFKPLNKISKFEASFKISGIVNYAPEETTLNERHSNSLGIISPKDKEGLYLPAGSFYPSYIGNSLATYITNVTIPKGYSVVLSGNNTSRKEIEGYSKTTWEMPFLVDEITLVGGKFVRYSKSNGKAEFNLFTYDSTKLAEQYLTAMAEYYDIYTKLFGDYPFQAFTIVENFFPTGFGMPGYTLLSGRLLTMPFVTLSPGSLAHEFVHNWWGNSVYVDYEKGNWCEALTTFSANYYYNVIKNKAKDELDWRKKALLAMDDLVDDKNYPVSKFIYQEDMDDAVIGYSKGAYILYEIYKLLGDEAFFRALKEFARDYRGKRAYWEDIIDKFVDNASSELKTKYNLKTEFMTWLNSTDIPKLELIPQSNSDKSAKTITINKTNDLLLTLPIQLEFTDGKIETRNITIKEKEYKFVYENIQNIKAIYLDNEYGSLRKLYKWEKPFTFNKILSSNPIIVAPDENFKNYSIAKEFYDEMIKSGYKCTFKVASEITGNDYKNNAIIAMGNAADNAVVAKLSAKLPSAVKINDGNITYGDKQSPLTASLMMANIENPENENSRACIIAYDGLTSFDPIRRLFHYQSYSLALLDINKPGRPIYSQEVYPQITNKNVQILKFD